MIFYFSHLLPTHNSKHMANRFLGLLHHGEIGERFHKCRLLLESFARYHYG